MAMNSLSVLGGNFVTKGELDLAGGLVHINTTTFSAVSVLRIDDVFSATYDNYLIFATNYVQSASGQTYIRMRASDSDATSGYINSVLTAGNTGVVAVDAYTITDKFYPFYNGASAKQSFSLRMYSPFLAYPTFYEGSSARSDDTAGRWATGRQTGSTSFDGFTLYPASGTITGTIRVYGYKNGA